MEINYKNEDALEKCRMVLKCYDLWVSMKIYAPSQEADVTWGPDANKNLDYSDYDRMRLVLSKKFSKLTSWIKKPQVDLLLTLGDLGWETKSYYLEFLFPIRIRDKFRIPLFIKYHNGPMSTLSDYTRHQNTIGIGVQFI